jgi:hypothetical protein
MEVKLEDKDKEIKLLCSLRESWDHLVTSIIFSSTNVLYYDTIMGDSLNGEMRINSSQENSTYEEIVVRG